MNPQVSNGEIKLFAALSRADLTHGMVTQQPIILKATIPDFLWAEQRKVVYLDGRQVHSSDKAQRRDEEIDNLMERQGWQVLRIVYDPPLVGKSLTEIVEKIRTFLNGEE